MIVNEHAELEKAKKSVDILQRGLLNLTQKYVRIFLKGKSERLKKFSRAKKALQTLKVPLWQKFFFFSFGFQNYVN